MWTLHIETVCYSTRWDIFNISYSTKINHSHIAMEPIQVNCLRPRCYKLNNKYIFDNKEGFHEAVGDTLALSVQTPKHLKEIGLLDEATPIDDYETSINFLMAIALKKVASLPFAYIIDKYRWAIFDGSVDISRYNAHWWELRYNLVL